MTRKEALKIAEYRDCKVLVERIYSDFESRTCENCRHMRGNDELGHGLRTRPICIANNSNFIEVGLDFGCNKWEDKDD